MPTGRPALVELPADDLPRARAFWEGVLGVTLRERTGGEGSGLVSDPDPQGGPAAALGVHERGRGPGDTQALPYMAVDDVAAALERVRELGGQVIHPGERFAVCRDAEGSPFGLMAAGA
jgi:uncharacterized protein